MKGDIKSDSIDSHWFEIKDSVESGVNNKRWFPFEIIQWDVS